MHIVLANCLVKACPGKSVVWFMTDSLDKTIAFEWDDQDLS